MSLAENTLSIAKTQVGVTEEPKGSNSGPQVNMYLKCIGLGAGFSWCMAFVYWCVNEACKQAAIPNPLVKTGGVMVQWNSTKLRLLPIRSSAIKPGDIFIMEFAHGLGHTGIVEKIEKGLVHTIEGNTNEDGSREGYEVARRVRSITQFKGFIQLP